MANELSNTNSSIPTVVVDGIHIRLDAAGRFCLNDLHKAAGGEDRHRPNYWLDLDQTKGLVAELSSAENSVDDTNQGVTPVSKRAGAPAYGGGTYVMKELVYAYAMWISAPFHIRVIRAYDHLVQQEQARQTAKTNMSRLEIARELVSALEREESARKIIAGNRLYPRVEPVLNREPIAIKTIKAEFVPYMATDKIVTVLRWYGQGRTRFQFGPHENASFQTFQRAGLEEVFQRFQEEATYRVSSSRDSVIITHDCLDQATIRVPKASAITCLGYTEADFVAP